MIATQTQHLEETRNSYGARRYKSEEEHSEADADYACRKLIEEATIVRKAKDNVTVALILFGLSPAAAAIKKDKLK